MPIMIQSTKDAVSGMPVTDAVHHHPGQNGQLGDAVIRLC